MTKFDPIQGEITGWAALSNDSMGEPIFDADGDHIPAAELERAVRRAFLARGGQGVIGDMHERYGIADLTESFVFTKEKRESLESPGLLGWLVSLRINDETVRDEVANGSKLELSIRGTADRLKTDRGFILRDLELSELELLSIVDRGASGNDETRPKIVLLKRAKGGQEMADIKKARSVEEILATLPEEDKQLMLQALAMAKPAEPVTEPVAVVPVDGPVAKPVVLAEDPPKPPEDEDEDEDEDEEAKKVSKATSELVKRNADLTKRLNELEAKDQRRDLVEVVKSDMAYVAGATHDEMADILQQSRANLSKSTAEKLETVLRSASACIKKAGLYASQGSDSDASGSPEQVFRTFAAELKKRSPEMTMSQALVEAGKERPDLYVAARKR